MASDSHHQSTQSPGGHLYQQGVAAYRAKAYDQAIAYFRQLLRLASTPADRVKAQMGLVRSHQRLGQYAIARQLCQQLQASPVDQARQWAEQTLRQLPAAGQTTVASIPTDLAQPAFPGAKRDLPQLDRPTTNDTGFVPFRAEPTAPKGPPSASAAAAAEAPQPPPMAGPATPVPSSSPPRPQTQTTQSSSSSSSAETTTAGKGGSLFHYQRLNQQPWRGPLDEAPGEPNSAPQAAAEAPAPAKPSVPSVSATTPRPQPLPRRPLHLWFGQAVTAIALVWGINWVFHLGLRGVNGLIRLVRWPVRFYGLPALDQSYNPWVIGLVLLLAVGSPWILDWLLARWHGQRVLSTRQLQQLNPQALTVLRQLCRRQGWHLPELRLIPESTPYCFSYGWHPRNTRIVVSQGMLDTLPPDQVVTLYSVELAHAINGALPVLSAVGLWLLVCHTVYGQLADWAEQRQQAWLRSIIGALAHGFYALYWGLRQLTLGLSRWRSDWGDRRTVVLTRQPRLLADTLIHLSATLASHSQHSGSISPILCSLGVLLPISPAQALSPGSFVSTLGLGPVVTSDVTNPYRQWLRINTSHLPLGERLVVLNQAAKQYGQPPLSLETADLSPMPAFAMAPLLRQKAPLVGLIVGGSLAMGLWFLGGVTQGLRLPFLSWLYQDPTVLWGLLLLGLGIGLLLRINTLYPEPPHDLPPESASRLISALPPLPVQGAPINLQGQLMGRSGPANWFCQRLYLACPEGLVRLACPSPFSAWQALRRPQQHPAAWIGRRVTVKGWGRRAGGELWLDIDHIHLDQRQAMVGHGPQWATLISLGISLWGIVIIFTGG
ncbi:zinc metalloprotease HtpX [Nodosilinea sp. P-1105]|uniref:zinc metalloprotease HtpX n=1 Tax=Nodosilinea sp. P-1105 TaxID=2546229 RepID=UPI00146D0871|nr:zinc metalloprotease HtpX [Nodosilinea sp. P-1105]NMF82226.1 hypothetical protein [Nodosilinea sp. P-1105]